MIQKMSKAFVTTATVIFVSVFVVGFMVILIDMAVNLAGNILPMAWTQPLEVKIDILESYFMPVAGLTNHLIGLVNFVVYTITLSTLAALLAPIKLYFLPCLFHAGRLLVILVLAIQATIAPHTVKMKGTELVTTCTGTMTTSIPYIPKSMTTVTKERFVYYPERLFSWPLRPKYAAPLCRLETDVGSASTVQIWKGLYWKKMAGFIYVLGDHGEPVGEVKRLSAAISPFQASQFHGKIREDFIALGARKTGEETMLGLSVEVWELSLEGLEHQITVAVDSDYPWILGRTLMKDGHIVARTEVTSLSHEIEIPLSDFQLPGHIPQSREVENISPGFVFQ